MTRPLIQYALFCDEPGCSASLVGQAQHEDAAIARVFDLAVRNDWAATPSSEQHFCAKHAQRKDSAT